MNFVSYQQLQKDLENFAQHLPSVDAVIGIPRSGLMAASKLALLLNVKLGWVERNGKGTVFAGGDRDTLKEVKNILILDDSLDTGNTMENVRRYFDRTPYEKVYFGVIYGSKNPINFPYEYFYQKIVPSPRFFEWNMWGSKILNNACLDIDGVVFDEIDEKTLKYKPQEKVLAFVTGRLELRRQETENQLAENGITYDELIMRRDAEISAEEFKAEIYKNKGDIFIESYDSQADIIARLTGKPVLSTQSMKLW